MQILTIILLIMVLLFLVGVLFVLLRQKNTGKEELLSQQLAQLAESINRNLTDSKATIDKSLTESRATLQEQVRSTAAIVRDVTERLTKLDTTNKRVQEFAGQLQSLENILRNPKHRGILGEYFLETLLSQVFQPGQYQMQYKFANGEIVDAVIFYMDQIIPIDAKFSLEKYNQLMKEQDTSRHEQLEKEFKTDIKNRIDETAKYIRPEEKTTNFAFMYIPAEGIYYNLLISKVGTLDVNSIHLLEYAAKKKVTVVSPVTMIAVLQTVIQGLKSNQIEKSVQDILGRVHLLSQHLNVYEEQMKRLGTQLGTTVNTYNAAYKEFGKVDKDIYKLTDGQAGGNVQILQLDKPQEND